MRARWEAHRVGLKLFLRTLNVTSSFRQLQPLLPCDFADPFSLIAFLADRHGDVEERDGLLRALITQAQSRSEVAIAILWLGLWCGLDRIYSHNLRRYAGSADDLVSDLSASFMAAVSAAQLERIRCLAATLLWNTERRLKAGLVRREHQSAREEELPEDDSSEALHASAEAGEAIGLEDDAIRMHGWLKARIPRDADLVFSTVVLEETQKAFAERAGLTHEAVRKRHQRALLQLRSVSHFGGSQRLSRVRGNKPPPRRARR